MHFERNPMGRKDGSALKKASYRSTATLFDARLNCTFKSKCNDDFISRSKILAPVGTPDILLTQEGLWNAAEAAERKSNSVYAQEFNAGLPHELTEEEQNDLIDDFVTNHYVKRGIICDTNIHLKPENNHFHCMMTTRHVDLSTDSLFDKSKNSSRDWWKMGSIQKDRDAYCSYINKHLEMAGSEVRYSGDTLEKQGIDRVPQIHVGPEAIAIDKRGEHSDRVEINNNIINFNLASAKVKSAKAELEKAKAEEKAKQKAEQEPSSNLKAIVQRQVEYLRLHGQAERVWYVHGEWITRKPTTPPVDTIERGHYKKSVDKWNYEGGEVRSTMKSIIKSIREVISDYFNQFNSDIRDDIEQGDNDIKDDDIEINGP